MSEPTPDLSEAAERGVPAPPAAPGEPTGEVVADRLRAATSRHDLTQDGAVIISAALAADLLAALSSPGGRYEQGEGEPERDFEMERLRRGVSLYDGAKARGFDAVAKGDGLSAVLGGARAVLATAHLRRRLPAPAATPPTKEGEAG